LVSQLARQRVKVCLSADGGDEIFAGYTKYLTIQKKLKLAKKLPRACSELFKIFMKSTLEEKITAWSGQQAFSERMRKSADLIEQNPTKLLAKIDNIFTETEVCQLLLKNYKRANTNFDLQFCSDWLSSIMALDYKTYMADDVLVKVDRASMASGLEGREPLLDYRLIEFLAQLPDEYKIHDGEKKRLLKAVTHKFLPQELVNRPKMGFGVPLHKWFKNELADYFSEYLCCERIKRTGIFRACSVEKLTKRYYAGDNTVFNRLWSLLVFELWSERWNIAS